jgi:hypothetical protein
MFVALKDRNSGKERGSHEPCLATILSVKNIQKPLQSKFDQTHSKLIIVNQTFLPPHFIQHGKHKQLARMHLNILLMSKKGEFSTRKKHEK